MIAEHSVQRYIDLNIFLVDGQSVCSLFFRDFFDVSTEDTQETRKTNKFDNRPENASQNYVYSPWYKPYGSIQCHSKNIFVYVRRNMNSIDMCITQPNIRIAMRETKQTSLYLFLIALLRLCLRHALFSTLNVIWYTLYTKGFARI